MTERKERNDTSCGGVLRGYPSQRAYYITEVSN